MKSAPQLPILRRLLLLSLGVLMAVPSALAQAPPTLENGYRNAIGQPEPAVPLGGTPEIPPVGDPLKEAYDAQRQNGTAFGGFSINGYGTLQPNKVAPPDSTYDAAAVAYPKSVPTVSSPVAVELRSAIIGRPVAVFNVSYNFGGVIPPPEKFENGQPLANFYRAEPLNARIKTPVDPVTLLPTGGPILDATLADQDGIQEQGGITYLVGQNPQFYWSKHARQVYATQPGTITIRWRELATVASKEETYLVATSPDKPERTLYWTENGFTGPLVEVPAGRVNAVNIIYNSLVPKEVATPYEPWISGVVDFAETDPAKKRYKTFYYETNLLHAYNVEGRVFIEYLGNPRPDGTSEQKGYEIVNIVKEALPAALVVDLGEEVEHLPVADADGGAVALEPRILAGLGLNGQPYLHQQISSGGTKTTLYAIRETQPLVQNAAKGLDGSVLVYWLETALLDLKWPKQFIGYAQQWPGDPAEYSVYARPDAGAPGGPESALATAVQLDSANNPALVYQDDPDNVQAQLVPGNKFYTTVTSADPTNRALLRFTRDDEIWFERVWSQLDPYFLNPEPWLASAPMRTRTATVAADPDGNMATGFANISNVRVRNATTGTLLVEGVDYRVDPASGVITLIEKQQQYIESVASLGNLNAGDTVEVRFYAGYSIWFEYRFPGPDWQIGSFSLLSGGSAVPGAVLDFRDGNGAFTSVGSGSAGPWDYDAPGDWSTDASVTTRGIGYSILSSPQYTIDQQGVTSLRLQHRYHFGVFGGSSYYDGGLIQTRVNGGAWQTVPKAAFTAGAYPVTISNLFDQSNPIVAGQEGFGGKSPGYDDTGTITAAEITEITFDAPALPFSEVPPVVDADIGTRIEPDAGLAADLYGEDAPVYVGYLQQDSGTAFNVEAYHDPFEVGFEEAAKGAIIGVNALAGNDQLEVWWYRKSTPRGSKITGTYWPSFVQKYQLQWPSAPDTIVLASNAGSGDLPSLQATGKIYHQNNPTQPGYNPNEEHALMLNGRAWALRDDLNQANSSEPYVLLHYTEADTRPAMRVFEVERGDFTYPAVAGKVLQSPMPLPLLPPPLFPDRTLASYEMPGVPDPLPVSTKLGTTDAAFVHYQKFTWSDRKGILWVYRGPHVGNDVSPQPQPTLVMRYFYKTLPGFYYPSLGHGQQPLVNTITPYLRRGVPGAYEGDPVTGEVAGTPADERKEQPLDITFTPKWPDAAPELRVGETLTLPKLGLPQVRGQQSAEFIYQQSVAMDVGGGGAMAGRQKSARLFDPTRAKVYPLSAATLPAIPASVNTSPYLGKIYFPNLPPHLSARLYFDPAVGANGSLVFKGVFMDEPVGEKYLQLNVMSAADVVAAKSLTQDEDEQKPKWDNAIDGLVTTMETFVEDPGKLGTYIPLRNETATPRNPIVIDGIPFTIPAGTEPLVATAPAGQPPLAIQRPPVPQGELAEVYDSDTAVDSYAISASGGGKGFVVLALGNGRDTDFTAKDGPVSLQVFKVAAPLYRGELKVINSANPLDEKLTLQHTGDFAGHPEEYDFEWRYAPPIDGLPPKLYSFVRKLIVGDNGSDWRFLPNPSINSLDPEQDYRRFRSPAADDSGLQVVALPGQITIDDGNGTDAHGTTLPNALLRRVFDATQRPLRLFLSLEVGPNDGALVYLNGAEVASYRVPGREDTPTTSVPATAPAFDPLPLVFEINANALIADAPNAITVELFTTADPRSTTNFNLRLEGSQEVENLIGWLPVTDPADVVSAESTSNNAVTPVTTGIVAVQGKNRHTIQGTSILTLSDNWLIMRYRARDPENAAYVAGGGWSKWTEPQLAEGWIKRVLAGINPFQQRVKDLFNHETNTSVSLVEQAGKRWEGDIALNLDNINDSGLIEIYETVLRRGKDLSITGTPAINYGGANDALLLAAGYLSDLYMILGNDAYADASNSTIAFSTESAENFITQYGDVATALFAFKGQLATVLDEELSLMRGRDDFLLPGTQKSPIYNRLIWNYTRGIDSGEAIYALNYNIKDRVWDFSINPDNPGSLPADGIISAADAAISYPQGHGDAYGHYLTALTGYYGLLNNPNFTWTPRIEAVLVLGTPVSVDYQDERKFAAAAAAVARSASRTLDLTYRKEFSATEDAEWSRLHDAKANPDTGRTRHWGTDDWASRGGQGAFFHWVTANSLLPAVDPNPNHSGIQKIDRTTVPELAEIAAQAATIQLTLDNADARLNPLGLARGGLAFDISPTEVDAGMTHYEQIFERATGALENAVSAFNNAKGSTQFLRQQEDTLADQRNAIDAQEQAFTNQLIELYGTPYTDDIGPGKTYKQGYAGPDLLHAMYVDLPEVFQDDGEQTVYTLLLDPKFSDSEEDFFGETVTFNPGDTTTFTLNARGDVVKPASWTGRRASPGRMQTAISDVLLARLTLQDDLDDYSKLGIIMKQQISLYESAVKARSDLDDDGETVTKAVATLAALKGAARLLTYVIEDGKTSIELGAEAAAEAAPKVAGLVIDPSFALRGAIKTSATIGIAGESFAKIGLEATIQGLDDAIERLNFNYQANVEDTALEIENIQLLSGLHTTLEELRDQSTGVDAGIRRLDQVRRDLYALQAKGDRIQQQRLVFRQHAAAIIQGYRTRDFAFRAFRDEALERYNALFDLAARYTYLAARAYDYETGLLDPDGNASAAQFYEKIVQARALGVISNGQPQFAGATTGDPGLSGVLAAMAGDWSVAKTRLGFNNPDRYRTTFSLREENFRLIPGTEADGDWKDLLSARAMDNILEDADVRRHAMQAGNPEAFAVPGIVVEFSTTIDDGYNFFGQPLASGDHGFSPTSFATKIRSSGVAFKGYIGMDDPSTVGGTLDDIDADSPPEPDLGFGDPNGLSATPYIYLIPAGTDMMRSPPLGDAETVRAWTVEDQAIPLPFNIADSDYSTQPAWVSAASLSEPPFMLRKHQAFRAVPDGTVFSSAPGFTNSRLIGRSVWNTRWKIVIPGNTLLNDPKKGVRIFLDTVKDIKVHFETYSYSGN